MSFLKRRHPTLITDAAPSQPYMLTLVPGVPLLIYPPPERRRHLALIGDPDWVDYWQLDLLAHSKESRIKSAVITGPADIALRALPYALDLPPELCDVRSFIEPGTDPLALRRRVSEFLDTVTPGTPTLVFMGHHLGHAWPFLLGRDIEQQLKNIMAVGDMSQQLKLPLAERCRYFLVQETQQDILMNAIERWHRHDVIKPTYLPTYLPKERSILFQY